MTVPDKPMFGSGYAVAVDFADLYMALAWADEGLRLGSPDNSAGRESVDRCRVELNEVAARVATTGGEV